MALSFGVDLAAVQLDLWEGRAVPSIALPATLRRLRFVTGQLKVSLAGLRIDEATQFATEHLLTVGQLSPVSVDRFTKVWRRFAKYARATGIALIGDVSDDLVQEFVLARAVTGAAPNNATAHFRRSSVRLLFRVLRSVGLPVGDPTLDLRLPARSSTGLRPLTDDEVDACRWASLATTVETRQPAAWALGEAGATTSEITEVRAADWRPDEGTVRIHGGARTEARLVPVTPWGQVQLDRRVRHLGTEDPSAPLALVDAKSQQSRQASACRALEQIMRRAGVAPEPDVRPGSVRAWAGVKVWESTNRIEEVALHLGLRSLDTAADLIGLRWRTPS